MAVLDDGFCEREPALAQLAASAVSGLSPAGPELRQGRTVLLRGHPGVEVAAPLSVMELGFSLHARTTAATDDTRAREQLVKYVLRPPIAQERLTLLPDELVRIQLKKRFKDGTIAVDLDPLSLLVRLASAVPPPRTHQVKYAGVLGAASKLRALIVPPPSKPSEPDRAAAAAGASSAHTHQPATATAAAADKPATHRSRYRSWAELLKRTFAIDVEKCAACGGHMKLKALVTRPTSIERWLRELGEPTEATPLSPARDPPFFKSRVLRRKLAELERAARHVRGVARALGVRRPRAFAEPFVELAPRRASVRLRSARARGRAKEAWLGAFPRRAATRPFQLCCPCRPCPDSVQLQNAPNVAVHLTYSVRGGGGSSSGFKWRSANSSIAPRFSRSFAEPRSQSYQNAGLIPPQPFRPLLSLPPAPPFALLRRRRQPTQQR